MTTGTVATYKTMTILLTDTAEIEIPARVRDLASFRRWVHSASVPESLKVFWLDSRVWLDLSREQIFTHVGVKGEFCRVLLNVAIELNLGVMLSSGSLYSNDQANFAVSPDALFISNSARAAVRVKYSCGEDRDYREVRGTPDMTLEVVSRQSVVKDTELLLHAYWKARIPEYWLVDARKSPARFEIYRHTADGYAATRRRDGWLKSVVFGKQFRFVESKDRFGDPACTLEVK